MAKTYEFANELINLGYDKDFSECLSTVSESVSTYFDIDIDIVERAIKNSNFIIQERNTKEIVKDELNNVSFNIEPTFKVENNNIVIDKVKTIVKLPYNFNTENMASIGDLVEGVLYALSYYPKETKIEDNYYITRVGFMTTKRPISLNDSEIILGEEEVVGIGLQEGFVADTILNIMRKDFYEKYDLRQEHSEQRLSIGVLRTIPEFDETAKIAFLTGNTSDLEIVVEGLFR